MTQYRVIDDRNHWRNDPNCTVKTDNDKMFVVEKSEVNAQGNQVKRLIMLNPHKFQEERTVDEKEATVLALKGIKLERINSEDQP